MRLLDWRAERWRPDGWLDDWRPDFAELQVDELMASLDAVAAPAAAAGEGGGGIGWFLTLGAAIAAVLGMLMVLVGQRRRLAREDARGLDGFSVDGDDEAYGRFDDLATVEIDEPVDELPFEDRVAAVVDERAENVVPIRQPEPEPVAEPLRPMIERAADARGFEAERDEEPAPARYAFAAGGGARMSADGPSSPLAQSLAVRSGGTSHQSAPSERFGGGGYEGGFGNDSNDQPFVAPFREDIERAERRQAERLDGLRDEVHRQFQTMKNENAARLDLFVSTVDRKLDGVRGSDVSEAALQHAVEAALRPVFDRLDGIVSHVATQERRLAELATLVERRLPDLMNSSADIQALVGEVQGTRADLGQTAERMASRVSEIGGGMEGLRETIERLERALLDRATADGEANVALTEVVRGTLPDGSYEFGVRLGNDEKVDCVIRFDGSRERVAIDAGFPMEAFNQLPSRDAVRKNLPQAKSAEDVFRRAILRAILEAADRCIVPGETTDSCLLFLPSEAAYTVLHDRFGDLVRDAQRARVWLTSPSTLMGTLNLLRNLMPEARTAEAPAPTRAPQDDEREAAKAAALAKEQARMRAEAERREKEREAMRAEIRALRERAAGLAGELDRTRGTLSDLIETTDRLSASAVQEPVSDLIRAETPADRAGRYDDEDTLPSLGDWAEDDRDDPFEDE